MVGKLVRWKTVVIVTEIKLLKEKGQPRRKGAIGKDYMLPPDTTEAPRLATCILTGSKSGASAMELKSPQWEFLAGGASKKALREAWGMANTF